MRRVLSIILALTIAVVFGIGFFAKPAAAKCPARPVAESSTTADARGSTSVNVSMTVWLACDGGYFASANSFKDQNGFAFHGTTAIDNIHGNPTASITCNFAGICNSPEIQVVVGTVIHGFYIANNGRFFSGPTLCGSTCFTTFSFQVS